MSASAPKSDRDQDFLNEALLQAQYAFDQNDVPIGAVVVCDDAIIGRGYNQKEQSKNATHHAELLALCEAMTHRGDWRLGGCTLYSTVEPCPMCAGAILHARVDRVVFGALDHKWGGVVTKTRLFQPGLFNHTVSFEHIPHPDCQAILSRFFKQLRS